MTPLISTGSSSTGIDPLTQYIKHEMEFLKEFLQFLKAEKRYWLIPLVAILLLLSIIIVASQGSALAPFIYSIF